MRPLSNPYHAVAFFGVDPNFLGRYAPQVILALSDAAGIEIDQVYYQPIETALVTKRFRQSDKARAYLSDLDVYLDYIGADERHRDKNEYPIAGMSILNRSADLDVYFPSDALGEEGTLSTAHALFAEACKLKAQYGFLVNGPDMYFVSSYAKQITCETMTEDESSNVELLGHQRPDLDSLLFRKPHDVYELNLLTNLHLDRRVGRGTLGTWIASKGAGVLERIDHDRWLWSVASPDLARIKRELIAYDALIVTH